MEWIRSRTLLCLCLALCLAGCAAQGSHESGKTAQPQGSYTLVGIGPGDPDLLTARALNVIRRADVVFCTTQTRGLLSPLVDFSNKNVIDGYNVLFRFYKRDCSNLTEAERTFRGMTCEQYHQKQADFVARVRQAVQAGQHVVMLSSGDPTIYGPDLWTIKALGDLSPVVVPGLSAFNAANAAPRAMPASTT